MAVPNLKTPGDSAKNADLRDNAKYNTEVLTGTDTFLKLNDKQHENLLWSQARVDETHWNKYFPFQLVLLEKKEGNYEVKSGQSFTLPIPPQALTISTPFAITGSVTLGGYLEEHNAAPIRNIVLQGTTGVAPHRGTPDQRNDFSLSGSIFGGTINGIQRTQAGVASMAFGTQALFTPNILTDDELKNGKAQNTTGYFQFMMLRNYLEQYANLKATKDGQRFRLGFAIWKDQEIYLVTPISFDMTRNSSSPQEYTYTLQLRAWRRWVPGSGKDAESSKQPLVRDPNAMAASLSRAQAARRALQGLKGTLTGFRGDVDSVIFGPVREFGLFIKDVVGVGLTAADLPVNIIKDMKEAILQAASVSGDFNALRRSVSNGSGARAEVQALGKKLRNLSVIAGIASTGADPIPGNNQTKVLQQEVNGAPGLGAHEADPANRLFDDPDKNPDLFAAISIGSLNLKPAIQKRIVDERRRVQLLTRLDFEKRRDDIIKLMADYADSVGAGAPTFSTTYNRAAPSFDKTPTDDDWEVLFHLNQLAMEFNRLAASTAVDDRQRLTAMEYIAGQASQAGIPFQVPASAFSIPFPYGSTLEMVADRYLNDPDRWHEIATLNNLRAPWVDEEGFSYDLLVSGSGNDIQVASIENLVIGQPVWLASTNQGREKRRITAIRSLSSTVHVLTVDGDADLSKFTTTAGAALFAFLPGTVNSLQLLFIPSDKNPGDQGLEPRPNPSINEFDSLLKVGGYDLLLTDGGDLAITKDGDCRWAQGMANIIQRVRIAMNTPIGTLKHHPGFGFGIQPGTSTADFTAQDILQAARQTFSGDPTFTGIVSASVVKSGPSLSIGMNLGIAGYSQLVPVNFRVRR